MADYKVQANSRELLNACFTSTLDSRYTMVLNELERLWNIESLAKIVAGGIPTKEDESWSHYSSAKNLREKIEIHTKKTLELIKAVK